MLGKGIWVENENFMCMDVQGNFVEVVFCLKQLNNGETRYYGGIHYILTAET